MSTTIERLTIEGYRSIRKLELELHSLNVLIGANGAGKSNFVGFFRLLRELVEQRLQVALQTIEGGADACLYMGPKVTQRLTASVSFRPYRYAFDLRPTPDNRLIFEEEWVGKEEPFGSSGSLLGSGQAESELKNRRHEQGIQGSLHGDAHYIYEAISRWVVYHFHDTGVLAGVRRQGSIHDNEFLRQDAENLAAFLYRIRGTDRDRYHRIRGVVRLAAPFFDDFKLRPVPTNSDLIQLEWLQAGSDYPFRPHQLSDGTLRFICLATALLQPSPPATMFFDEPELGLHPYALTLLGNLFQQAAEAGHQQLIVSTQSALLLNEFAPEDIVVVERHKGESIFRRLEAASLSEWLAEYSLGELWQKNVLGGRPGPENAPELVPGGEGRR